MLTKSTQPQVDIARLCNTKGFDKTAETARMQKRLRRGKESGSAGRDAPVHEGSGLHAQPGGPKTLAQGCVGAQLAYSLSIASLCGLSTR